MEATSTTIKQIWDQVIAFSNTTLFHLGDVEFTLATIIFLILGSILLLFFSKKVRNILVKRILQRYGIEPGTSKSIGTIVYYLVLTLGFFIIIQAIGIDLTGLSVIAGALGVGIGFGLQNITNNFISGIIILFERPIKEGDWIEVGETNGTVTKISARSTTVLTNDNVSVIVPNSEFINSRVINWSHNDRDVRFKIPVGVSYNEDPQQIKELLLQVLSEHPGVLKKPEPTVLFSEFGDSSLNFILAGWTTSYIDRPGQLKSEINYAIHEIFKQHNIEIPFPQRDIHIRSRLTKEIT